MSEVKQGNNSFYLGTEEHKHAEITFVPTGKSRIIIDHTFVDQNNRGQGLAELLLAHIVDYARREKLEIIPLCPFAKVKMEQNNEFHDVLAK